VLTNVFVLLRTEVEMLLKITPSRLEALVEALLGENILLVKTRNNVQLGTTMEIRVRSLLCYP